MEIKSGIYRHYKGLLYQVLFVGQDSSNDLNGRILVTYVPLQLDGAPLGYRVRHRKINEFLDYLHSDGTTCIQHVIHSHTGHWCYCEYYIHQNIYPRFNYLGPEMTEEILEMRTNA